ncbi:MAG: CARDB domain-containing protein [Candidatus Methanomethylicaceae archaeon]
MDLRRIGTHLGLITVLLLAVHIALAGCTALLNPARFVVLSLEGPRQVFVGDIVSYTATVENRGGTSGTTYVNFYIGGNLQDSQNLSLKPGEILSVTAKLSFTKEGTALVEAKVKGGSSVSLTVTVSRKIPISTPPSITYVEFPSRIPANGTLAYGEVGFYDPDADVVRASFEVLLAVSFQPFTLTINAWGQTSGSFSFSIYCYTAQFVTLGVTLIDSVGNKSARRDFSFTCESVTQPPPPSYRRFTGHSLVDEARWHYWQLYISAGEFHLDSALVRRTDGKNANCEAWLLTESDYSRWEVDLGVTNLLSLYGWHTTSMPSGTYYFLIYNRRDWDGEEDKCEYWVDGRYR